MLERPFYFFEVSTFAASISVLDISTFAGAFMQSRPKCWKWWKCQGSKTFTEGGFTWRSRITSLHSLLSFHLRCLSLSLLCLWILKDRATRFREWLCSTRISQYFLGALSHNQLAVGFGFNTLGSVHTPFL
jgi:hypothetical protein